MKAKIYTLVLLLILANNSIADTVQCRQSAPETEQYTVDCVKFTVDEDYYESTWVSGRRYSPAIIDEAVSNALKYINTIGCNVSISIEDDWTPTLNGTGAMTEKGHLGRSSWLAIHNISYNQKYRPPGETQDICLGAQTRNTISVAAGRYQNSYCPAIYPSVGLDGSGGGLVCYSPSCPPGQKWWAGTINKCVPVLDVYLKNNNCSVGNPIHPLSGNKREIINLGLMLSGMISLDIIYDSGQAPWTYDQINGPYLNSGKFGIQPGETPFWGDLGKLWWLSSHKRIALSPNGQNIRISRGDGKPLAFNFTSGAWVATSDTQESLIQRAEGYLYKNQESQIQELYSTVGLMTARQHASGMVLTAIHANERIQKLSDPFGRNITFTYKTLANGDVAIDAITDPALKSIVAQYDTLGNLINLRWQDGMSRSFTYDSNHANQWWALTGVSDENSKKYSKFQYSENGWAKSTERTGNIEKYEISYQSPPYSSVRESFDSENEVIWRFHEWKHPTGTQILYPSGIETVLSATAVMGASGQTSQGSIRGTGASQPAGAGCAASSSALTYDNRGNISSQDDFNGKRVCYSYESGRNFENVRIEGLNGGGSGNSCTAALSASNVSTLAHEARKISTEWHPDWKLETRRAEPGRITTWVYNGQPDPFNGGAIASCTSPMYGATSVDPLPDGKPIVVLCKQVIQSTTDVNGSQGFSATLQTQDPAVVWPQVTSRTTSYTYNQFGQVLTSTDERGQVTTNTYYTATNSNFTKGDLWKVTNALGHVTEYTQYNPHGQVLQVLDPNGVATSYTYDLRQRLTSVTQAGQLTQIDWWPTGLLKKVTQPDGSFLAYAYDDAHRLTDIADNLGNTVHYELDNAGNRKKEQVKDSAGLLTRQIDRNYDALNRLWKTSTGAPM